LSGPDRRVDVWHDTLELLEWPRLCQHLAQFASTAAGQRRCLDEPLPSDLRESRERLARSIELAGLDGVLDGGLSFQGVHDLEPVLLRCCKGGTADGEALLAVADTLAAARRLRRQIDDPELRPPLHGAAEGCGHPSRSGAAPEGFP
jgi:Mismatch repair ATPase (MutS family)